MMKIFNASQIKHIDECTIASQGILSIDLMERAALAVCELLIPKLGTSQAIYVFAGTGNNGGDGLAIARILLANHFHHLRVFIVAPQENYSSDCAQNKKRLENLIHICRISEEGDIPEIPRNSIIIDCLFGSGLNRTCSNIYSRVIEAINGSESIVYSIDMPSGLFVEDNTDNNPNNIIRADETFSCQSPKLSLLLPDSQDNNKQMTLVDIGLCEECIENTDSDYYYIEKKDIRSLRHQRNKFSHKGDYGRALLIAGSFGKMGAAVMSAKACLRAGVGLLTAHVPRCGVDIMQISVPEAMVETDDNLEFSAHLTEGANYQAIGVGPGIGTHEKTRILLRQLFAEYRKAMVIDADGLNLISEDEELAKMIPPSSILTPHPVEFERLTGIHYRSAYTRLQAARKYASEHRVYIVLKGAYSAIITPEGKVYFNSTGNPGMATGGSGDVLTGIITSLLAQKYTPHNAAILGTYLHSYAGDLAAKSKSHQAMLPTDIIECIGEAYKSIEK